MAAPHNDNLLGTLTYEDQNDHIDIRPEAHDPTTSPVPASALRLTAIYFTLKLTNMQNSTLTPALPVLYTSKFGTETPDTQVHFGTRNKGI